MLTVLIHFHSRVPQARGWAPSSSLALILSRESLGRTRSGSTGQILGGEMHLVIFQDRSKQQTPCLHLRQPLPSL